MFLGFECDTYIIEHIMIDINGIWNGRLHSPPRNKHNVITRICDPSGVPVDPRGCPERNQAVPLTDPRNRNHMGAMLPVDWLADEGYEYYSFLHI